MGEVKVHVKISNAMDVAMYRRGLLPRDQIRTVTVEAVVDAGAVRSCIPIDLKEKLGLETERHIKARMANGQTQSVGLTEAAYIDIMDRLATESFLVLGSETRLGRTVLASTDLFIDGNRTRVITNPDHPNSAVIRIRRNPDFPTVRLAGEAGTKKMPKAIHVLFRPFFSASSAPLRLCVFSYDLGEKENAEAQRRGGRRGEWVSSKTCPLFVTEALKSYLALAQAPTSLVASPL